MKSFTFQAVVTVVLALLIFFLAVFFKILPALERAILDQKREMIRELTNSATNILARFETDERAGRLTREEAQRQAIQQIRNLHYGREMKDYFWINDFEPRMVVHPYRTDLEGQSLASFTDPRGKRLFVEMAEVAKRDGSGYVDYMWQWKDDPARILPKISFVKAFHPWQWIIGTGVYKNDVDEEIARLRDELALFTLAVLTLAAGLLGWNLWGGLRAERRRLAAENALKNSEERYRAAVQSAGEGIIMALEPDNWLANQVMLESLGYTLDEFRALKPEQILVMTDAEQHDGRYYYQALLEGRAVPPRYEARLRTKAGAEREVLLSLSPVSTQGRRGFIAVATDMSAQRAKELAQDRLISEMEAGLHFLNRAVADICDRRNPVVPAAMASANVLKQLLEHDLDVLEVVGDETKKSLFVTREALLEKLALDPRSGDRPIGELCKACSVAEISSRELVFQGYRRLEENRFRPLLVRDDQGALVGVLASRHISQISGFSPTLLLREIGESRSPQELARANRRMPQLVRALVRNGISPVYVNHLISENADAVMKKAIAFALDTCGPAPVPFAFLVMGSAARNEQTVCTDQDNALMFADVEPGRAAAVHAFFLKLGGVVCEILHQCGFAYCKGEVMANNAEWVQSYSDWVKTFEGWVTALEPKDLLHTKIFFDVRAVVDETKLVDNLYKSLWSMLDRQPRFFGLLAHNIQQLQPPLGVFGDFVCDPKITDRQAFDIKLVMAIFVDFARIYALRQKIAENNTVERLDALRRLGVLTSRSHAEMVQAYIMLMKMRIDVQVKALEENRDPDNYIEPELLTSLDQRVLKEVFEKVKHLQLKLGHDFTGSVARL